MSEKLGHAPPKIESLLIEIRDELGAIRRELVERRQEAFVTHSSTPEALARFDRAVAETVKNVGEKGSER